jgi:hypothetical protein
MKLFLHICCAIDEYVTLKAIENKKLEIKTYFYNPNIFPYEEYIKRYRDVDFLNNEFNLKKIESTYDKNFFIEKTKEFYRQEENSSRCEKCIRLRLENTAKKALENNYYSFSTTLMASPKKIYEKISSIGNEVSKKYKIKFFSENYKKIFPQSLARNQMKGKIYIQNYCGCLYGLINQNLKRIEKDKKDFKNLYEHFFPFKDLWKFRGKSLIYSDYLPPHLTNLKQLLGIVKPGKLIIDEHNSRKLELYSKWLKCPGYNCRVEIRR